MSFALNLHTEWKWYPLDEVDREELAQGLKIPVYVPKRLNGEFAFPAYHLILGNPVSNSLVVFNEFSCI